MRRLATTVALLLAATACTGDDGPAVETAEVVAGEVVQTVAAPAELEPAGRVTVTAPVGGEVAELLVGDGDVVEAGDPLVRLASDSVDLQVAQAEAALEAADALGAAGAAGMDLAPLFGAFRGQLDAVFPPLLDTLDDQLTAVVAAAEDTDLVDLDDAVAAARDRLAEAEAAYRDASNQLLAAEREASQQARQASAGQAAAAEAQREQAELALEAARARIDDLAIVAPTGGVVELARPGDGDPTAALPELDDLADGAGDVGDLGDLLAGGGGTGAGPVAEGVNVGPGQPLLTIFDLSGFTARALVDELDVAEVEEGQPVTVLVDAFPDAELAGGVTFVALTPERAATGGTSFPVTVQLTDVPADVRLRIGLTASAEIEVRRVDGDTVVPTSALLRRGTGEVVHVVRDGVAVEVPVTVVAMGDDTAAVDGDLRAGEEVVTTGVELVEDGDEIPG